MKKLKKDTRVILFFTWATGEGDSIDLPYGMLRHVVQMFEKFNQDFLPIVQVGKKKFYFASSKGTLRPLL